MPENSLRVVARVKARPDKVGEALAVLKALVEPTRQEEGCVSYELLQNRTDPTDFTFVEEWASDSAIESHFSTDHVREAFSKAQDLLEESPDIRTYTVAG